MIVVKVELWDAQSGRVRELFRMTLANDGTLTEGNRGNYDVKLYRRGWAGTRTEAPPLRRGRVVDFPRKSYHTGRLILRALKSVFPEEK